MRRGSACRGVPHCQNAVAPRQHTRRAVVTGPLPTLPRPPPTQLGPTHPDDGRAMASVSASIFGGSPLAAAAAGWPLAAPACAWAGVACDRDTGRVTAIALPPVAVSDETPGDAWMGWLSSARRAAGSFPSDVGRLPFLRSLALSSRGLRDRLPDTFANATALVSIDVSSNRLAGPVPASLMAAPSLAFVNLSRNAFSGALPPLAAAPTTTASPVRVIDATYNAGLCPDIVASPGLIVATLGVEIGCGGSGNTTTIAAAEAAAAAAAILPAAPTLLDDRWAKVARSDLAAGSATPPAGGLNAAVSGVGGALVALLGVGLAVQLARARSAAAAVAREDAARAAASAARAARRASARGARAAAAVWRPPGPPPTVVLGPDGGEGGDVWVAKREWAPPPKPPAGPTEAAEHTPSSPSAAARGGSGSDDGDAAVTPSPPRRLSLARTETQATEATSPGGSQHGRAHPHSGHATTPVAGASSPALRVQPHPLPRARPTTAARAVAADIAALRSALGDAAATDLVALLARLDADAVRSRSMWGRAGVQPAPMYSVTVGQREEEEEARTGGRREA